MWKKIFDINNQLKQVTNDIKASNKQIHAIEVSKQGLLYINSVIGVANNMATGNYCLIGVVDSGLSSNDERLKLYLQNIINEYNELRSM